MLNIHENHTNRMTAEFEDSVSDMNQPTDADVAHFVIDLLDDNAQHLTAVTAKRLSVARSLAVGQLVSQQGLNHSGNVLTRFGDQIERHRTMSTAIVVGAMLLAFYAAQQFGFNANLEEGDAFLLASDLPPEAYADKGFDTWLVSKND